MYFYVVRASVSTDYGAINIIHCRKIDSKTHINETSYNIQINMTKTIDIKRVGSMMCVFLSHTVYIMEKSAGDIGLYQYNRN